MRGKLKYEGLFARGVRITPAHAGKTQCATPVPWRREDHPRACGENPTGIVAFPPVQGSPPRMRGKPSVMLIESLIIGITPAHAGKT